MGEVQATLVKREPWPKHGIENYESADQGQWGYLLQYSDNTFDFIEDSVPTIDEILERWGSYFS